MFNVKICVSYQAKSNGPGSRCSSTSSLNSLASDALAPNNQNGQNGRNQNEWNEGVISQNQVCFAFLARINIFGIFQNVYDRQRMKFIRSIRPEVKWYHDILD